MTNIATHVRIFDSDPDDDLVVKRTAAIKDLASRYSKEGKVAAIFQTANDIAAPVEARGKVSDAMSKEVESAVRNGGADAFVAAGQDLQVKVCALLAALELLESAAPTTGDLNSATVLAIGLWSALSFQAPLTEPKLEGLRADLMEVAHKHVIRSATSSRQRAKVPDVNIAAAESFDPANVAKSVSDGLRAAFNALRTNAAVDREEIDLLWWVLSDWSTLLDRRYSGVTNSVTGALASGIEAGRMLRRLPGDAHRNLVLRHVKQGAPISLADVIKSLGDDRILLANAFPNQTVIAACSSVFPLLGALISGSATHARAKQKRPVSEWAARALLETAAVHVTSILPVAV
jgi:GTPase-associated system helical domain